MPPRKYQNALASPRVLQDIVIRFMYIKFELGVIGLTYIPDLHPTIGIQINPRV